MTQTTNQMVREFTISLLLLLRFEHIAHTFFATYQDEESDESYLEIINPTTQQRDLGRALSLAKAYINATGWRKQKFVVKSMIDDPVCSFASAVMDYIGVEYRLREEWWATNFCHIKKYIKKRGIQ